MKYEVDGWNNFCRVFELPDKYPKEYCFGIGHPVNFQMVDWFNPVPDIDQPAVSKEVWKKEVGEIEVKEVDIDELFKNLIPFLLERCTTKGKKYIILCDFGACITFDG